MINVVRMWVRVCEYLIVWGRVTLVFSFFRFWFCKVLVKHVLVTLYLLLLPLQPSITGRIFFAFSTFSSSGQGIKTRDSFHTFRFINYIIVPHLFS